MKDTFSSYHPIVNFVYFTAVLVCSMFFMHPVFLIISLVCGIVYSTVLNGRKAVRFNLFGMLPMLLIIAVMNPVFNHQGMTILVYVNDQAVTLESILYGVAAATMFISVIIWFSCYNAVMTSDKFIYLFGRIIPALSLVFSMVLRLVPKFKAQITQISNAQKCIGKDAGTGSLVQRAKNGMAILSVLTTWALENAIETADSMRSRGYGLKGRTSFSAYRFVLRDKIALVFLTVLGCIITAGAWNGENTIQYFPNIIEKARTPFSIMVYTAYAGLCLLPVIVEMMEAIKWHHLKSKI